MFKIILSTDKPSRKIRLLRNWGKEKLPFRRSGTTTTTTVIEQCTTIGTLCTTTISTIYTTVDGDNPVSSSSSGAATTSSPNVPSVWSGPHTVVVPRTDAGFGFTLRHFIVYPPESSATSQAQDGASVADENDPEVRRHKRTKLSDLEPMDTIFVKHVKEDSPAELAGLNTGDRIVSVNGESVTGKTYSQVISLIQSSDALLKLLVVPQNEDILQMAYKNTAYNQAASDTFISNHSSSTPVISVKPALYSQSAVKETTVYIPDSAKERKVSFTFGENQQFDPVFSTTTIKEINPSPLESSTTFSSGISLQREPLVADNMNKAAFLDRKREFELRASQTPENKIDSYSFGLYFPPKKDQQKSSSIDNIYMSSSSTNTNSLNRRRASRETVLQSRESFDNVSRSESHFQSPLYNAKDSRQTFSTTLRTISSDNKVFPRSRTTSSLSSIANSSSQVLSAKAEFLNNDHSSPVEASRAAPSYCAPVHSSVATVGHAPLQISPLNRSTSISPYNSSNNSDGIFNRSISCRDEPNTQSRHITYKTMYGTPVLNKASPNPTTTASVLPMSYNQRPVAIHRKSQFDFSPSSITVSTNSTPTTSPFTNSTTVTPVRTICMVSSKRDSQSLSSAPLSPTNRYKTEIEKITSRGKFESVATRAAQFESKPNEVSLPSPVVPLNYKQHRSSVERIISQDNNYKNYSCTPVQVPAERTTTYKAALTKSYSTPVSPNQDTTPVQTDKSLLDTYSRYESTPSVNNYSTECDLLDVKSNTQSEAMDFKTITKPSFITSINASVNNTDSSLLNMSSCAENLESYFTLAGFDPDQVTLRKKPEDLSPELDAVKLQRRTSYLMATAKERSDLNTPLQTINKLNTITPDKLSLPIYDTSSQTVQTKKLKSSILIEEKTSTSIEEEPFRSDLTPLQSSSPPKETKKEGILSCKNAITDGKRSSDRSWKPCLVLLRGQDLYVTDKRKDNNSVQQISKYDQPVSIKSSSVEVATDYTKKKNVFRLTIHNPASEFLFQAEDSDTMKSWIQALRSSSDTEIDYETTSTPTTNTKSSPQMPVKTSKRLPGLSFRQKVSHSPNPRRRKNNDGTKTKSWKEKIRFKNKGSNQPPAPEEASGSFGVHLELCTPSPYKESIPFVIDLCTSIVETRGLKVVGVYRIPGNKLVISNMQEEFNKGLDHVNQENEKWQDVNVISSLLKSFFQKLPEPLVTNELYQSFIMANQIENPQSRMQTLKRIIHQLPDVHFETFRHLALHLRKVADHSHINKMCARNLAIVLGPTLVRRHDEDVQAMAIDMSHQCRIIESVILHPNWFFSSRDVDDHVPVEDNTAADVPTGTVSPMGLASTPDDDDDDSEETNPLEIVAAMIAAAKNKSRIKKTKGSDETESSTPPGVKHEERNIDAEIAKYHANKASVNSMDLMSDGSLSQLDTISYSSRVTSEHKASVSSLSIGFEDYADWDVFSSKSSNPHLARQFSDESLLEKSDELEFSYGLHKNYSHSLESNLHSKQEFLKKVQEKHKRECEVREKESKRFDQEYQRTKHEMELEDKHSLEELLNSRKILYSANYPFSGTSPYSKPYESLEYNQMQGKGWAHSTSASKVMESASGGGGGGGGKYFVSVGNSKIPDRTSYLSTGLDNAKRSNSLETIIDPGPVWSSPLPMVPRRTQERELSPQNDSDLGLPRRNSLRRGSLDSMIDFYDKKENRFSWASTDSEDGSDLLTSLASTFDQKLQILLNPKYKLNGSSRPRPPSNIGVSPLAAIKNNDMNPSNSSVYDCTSESLELAQAESTRMLNLGLAYSRQAKKNTDVFDSFRDPSLHRTQKPETKIGIASRFTRSNSGPTAHALGDRAIITHGAAPIAASHLASSSEFLQRRSNGGGLCTDYIDSKLPNLGKAYSLSSPSSSSPQTDYHLKKNLKSSSNKNNCYGIGYRSENKNSRDSGGQQTWTLRSNNSAKANTSMKSRCNSPPPIARRKIRGKRRHTVGGSEHYNTLVLLLQRKDDSSRTVLKEPFQPTHKIKEVHDYSPLAWLQAYSFQTGSSDLSFSSQPTYESTHRKL